MLSLAACSRRRPAYPRSTFLVW